MISLLPKVTKQRGAATIVITVLMLITLTLIILFAASFSLLRQKILANNYRNNQAYEAAEAGLEFAIPYLQTNRIAIIGTPVSGIIPLYSNSNTQNVVLANGSSFSITYSNPIAFNYNLIQISVTGTSDDGAASRTIIQLAQFGSMLTTTPQSSLQARGSVGLTGSSLLSNTTSNLNIQAGGAVTLGGTAMTLSSSGTSTAGNFGSDIQQNQSSISSLSSSDFFANYFGASASTVKANFANYYSNTGNTNYSSTLNGKAGTSIWIDQTGGQATLSGTTVIGSPTNPVLMVVNGDFRISGSTIIYGFLYIAGDVTTDITGSVVITGGVASSGNLSFTGNTTVNYSSAVLTATQSVNNYFAKVPGSWRDF